MKTKGVILSALVLASFLVAGRQALAMDCFQDPVYQLDQTAKVIIGARVRDVACMDGSVVLKVLPLGKSVHVIGSTDGWYKIDDDGVQGWVGMTLLSITDASGYVAPAATPTAVPAPAPVSAAAAPAVSTPTVVVDTAQPAVTFTPADSEALNQYWLDKINALRVAKNLRLLNEDARFVTTAQRWADYMASLGYATHTRKDGKTMHQWIVKQPEITFTKRYSADGWRRNYFTENIAWQRVADSSAESLEKALDKVLAMFLKERSYNGAHYRTIYHPDWNSLGLGYTLVGQKDGSFKVYFAFHYGSLEPLK